MFIARNKQPIQRRSDEREVSGGEGLVSSRSSDRRGRSGLIAAIDISLLTE
jgi:hypothetical protein